MSDPFDFSYISDLKREIKALRGDVEARLTAIEDRLAAIEKQLYVPPELVKALMEQSAKLDSK